MFNLSSTYFNSAYFGPTPLKAKALVEAALARSMDPSFIKRNEFRGSTESELAAWLREILKHKLADALRDQHRDKRDIRRECTFDEGIDASFSRTEGWLVSLQSSPSQKAVKQEDLLRLSQALTELPEAQREVIVLHHLQGQKLAEVAAEMDRSEAAVAGLLFRGLRTLHTLLGD